MNIQTNNPQNNPSYKNAASLAAMCKTQKQRGNGQYQCTCPVHEGGNEKRPSLSIADGKFRTVLRCHYGCSEDSVLSALGVDRLDLFPNNKAKPQAKRSIIDRFEWQTIDGQKITKRRWNTGQKFSWSKAGIVKPDNMPLYRSWDGIFEDTSQVIHFTEGEKDARSLARLGYVATCRHVSKGRWHKPQFFPLKGRRVVIVPDADEAGRAFCRDWCAALRNIPKQISIIDLPDGKDLTDFVEAGGDFASLVPIDRRQWLDNNPAPAPSESEKAGGKPQITKDEKGIEAAMRARGIEAGYETRWRCKAIKFNDPETALEHCPTGEWLRYADYGIEARLIRDIAENCELLERGGKSTIPARFTRTQFVQYTDAICHANPFDRIKEYLLALEPKQDSDLLDTFPTIHWDFREDISKEAIAYLGRSLIMGVICRTFAPDNNPFLIRTFPVLFGKQGCGKSSFFSLLVPKQFRTTGGHATFKLNATDRGLDERTDGSMIAVCEELAKGSRIVNIENVREMFTDTICGRETKKYQVESNPKPRRFHLAGTSNPDGSLPQDDSGNTRFFPYFIVDDLDDTNHGLAKIALELVYTPEMVDRIWAAGMFELKANEAAFYAGEYNPTRVSPDLRQEQLRLLEHATPPQVLVDEWLAWIDHDSDFSGEGITIPELADKVHARSGVKEVFDPKTFLPRYESQIGKRFRGIGLLTHRKRDNKGRRHTKYYNPKLQLEAKPNPQAVGVGYEVDDTNDNGF